MKKLILFCFALGAFLVGFSARADWVQDQSGPDQIALWLPDRQIHMLTGYAVSFTCSELLAKTELPRIICPLSVLAISWVKEKNDPIYSSGDIKSAMLGAGFGFWASVVIHL